MRSGSRPNHTIISCVGGMIIYSVQYLFFVASAGFSARDLDSLPPFVHARKELDFVFVKGQHSGS